MATLQSIMNGCVKMAEKAYEANEMDATSKTIEPIGRMAAVLFDNYLKSIKDTLVEARIEAATKE